MTPHPIGTRVRLKGHWEFPDGTTGIISPPPEFAVSLAEPGEWSGHVRTHQARNGVIHSYFVVFDSLTDDGSGDGPYCGGEIDHDAIQINRD